MLHFTPAQLFDVLEIYRENMILVCAIPSKCLIHLNNEIAHESLTKEEFMARQSSLRDKMIVVYCASYSCSAGSTFAQSLNLENCTVADYQGGLHEWALLSIARKDSGDNNPFQLIGSESKTPIKTRNILKLMTRTASDDYVNNTEGPVISGHWYSENKKQSLENDLLNKWKQSRHEQS